MFCLATARGFHARNPPHELHEPRPSSKAFWPARSSTRAATRPSRSTSRWTRASVGTAAVPSGASTGEHEALELRDGDKKRYLGKGVQKAVRERRRRCSARWSSAATPSTRPASTRRCWRSTARPTRGRWAPTRCWASRWRRRAPRPPSSACRSTSTWAGPNARVLPVPLMNIINGGAHADNSLDFQEFMIVPKGAAELLARRCAPAPRCSTRSRSCCTIARRRPASATRAASPPTCRAPRRRCGVVVEAIEKAGYKPGKDVALALDVASSELWDKTSKTYKLEGERQGARRQGDGRLLHASSASSSRSCRSRTAWPRTTGTAGWR